MLLFRIAVVVTVFAMVTFLFHRASGSLKFTKLNMISTLYANFGYAGMIIAPIIFGVVIGFFVYLLPGLRKSRLLFCCMLR